MNRRHNGCGSLTNGYAGTNGDDDDEVHHYECNDNTATKDHYPSQTSSNHQNESHVKEEEQQQPNEIIVGTNAVQLNDPMREVLSNETSVDDIEPNEQQQVNINRPGEGTDNVAHVPPEPVEQVVQLRNLQINEDGHEDVTASIPGASSAVQQQSSHTSTTPVTITVSAITQSMTTNTEVPLVA